MSESRAAGASWQNQALSELNAIYECRLGDARDTFRDGVCAFGDRGRGGGRKSELLAGVGEARRRAIRVEGCEVAGRFGTANGIAIPVTAYVIVARRSGGRGG